MRNPLQRPLMIRGQGSSATDTITIEGFWSILTRSVDDAFHEVSAKYLPHYVAESSFRYNKRENDDISGCDLRLLTRVLILLAIAAAAVGLWFGFEPSYPNIPVQEPLEAAQGGNTAGGGGCEPKALAALSGASGLRERDRCAQAAEDQRTQAENIRQARREARAAEQGAIEAYAQARATAAQDVLLFLAFAAAVWGAFEAAKAARIAERTITDLERPWLHLSGCKIDRRDLDNIKNGASPIPNYYFVIPILKNAGRMLAIIESIEFQFVEQHLAPEEPDYSNLLPLNHPIFVQPKKKTPNNQRDGSVGPVGPDHTKTQRDYVFYGRIKYRGLITKGHLTGFGVSIWAIGPASTSFGGEKYNYHT